MLELKKNYEAIPTTNKNKTSLDNPVRVVFYGRVSTEHDSQLLALDNQLSWYESVLRDHPNWEKVGLYVDRGVTGTSAKKRHGFMQMIEDAQKGGFDLICTRECSRFARNTVDSLSYTRVLASIGVEVFFYNDNIWSLEADGELRLTIMSAMSQEESRHISDRVLAGQKISRENKVLFGSGNCLGYDLKRGSTSVENTYIINEEQAETVRMIFKYYIAGMGSKFIAKKLMEEHRATATGLYNWDATSVLRVIDNKTYCGYIGYNKSKVRSFLDHTRINNRNYEDHVYVKGDFPEIISEEDWNLAHAIREKRKRKRENQVQETRNTTDKWKRHLLCNCGYNYTKYKWRTNQSGESYYGYQCSNQVRNRKKSFRLANGLETEGYCDIPAICEWKLDFMLKSILDRLWKDREQTVTLLTKIVEKNQVEEKTPKDREAERQEREYARLTAKLDNLLEMRLDGKITTEQYEAKEKQIKSQLEVMKAQIKKDKEEKLVVTVVEKEADAKDVLEEIKLNLEDIANLDKQSLSEELVDNIVSKIIPTEEGVYKWYLDCNSSNVFNTFNTEKFASYDSFTLGFEEARAYRKRFGNYIRARQWNDLNVEVYVRVE